ncbi:MAG: hypothetical protein LBR34_11905 [Prevotella sp.]|jgi:major membrane immunogen (membrane-anchored lipoprotein)|nr:hypothetical protein [Prevotella sp.]
MKKRPLSIVLAAVSFILMTSCGNSKQTANTPARNTNPFSGNTYEAPCAMYDDNENFAATGIASGPATQKGSLQLIALKNAQDLIAQKMQHAVEGEVKSFFESVGSNQGTDVDAQTIGGINNIILGIANNTTQSCLRFSEVDDRGNIECYSGIKISKEKVANAVADNLSKNKKTEIRERAEDFRKQMAEDLKNYKGE